MTEKLIIGKIIKMFKSIYLHQISRFYQRKLVYNPCHWQLMVFFICVMNNKGQLTTMYLFLYCFKVMLVLHVFFLWQLFLQFEFRILVHRWLNMSSSRPRGCIWSTLLHWPLKISCFLWFYTCPAKVVLIYNKLLYFWPDGTALWHL